MSPFSKAARTAKNISVVGKVFARVGALFGVCWCPWPAPWRRGILRGLAGAAENGQWGRWILSPKVKTVGAWAGDPRTGEADFARVLGPGPTAQHGPAQGYVWWIAKATPEWLCSARLAAGPVLWGFGAPAGQAPQQGRATSTWLTCT